ncbi:MAG: tetratricopeptide repeat protein [Flavisolibacter sp.]
MKQSILCIGLLFSGGSLLAQNLQEANQFLYYERYQGAENAFHTLLLQQPGNAEAWYGLTRSYLAEHKPGKAMDSLLLAPPAIREKPFYDVARGAILLEENKKDSAAVFFNSALKETREKDENVLGAVARSHIESPNGDPVYASALLTKAAKRDRKNPAWAVLKGDAYRKANNGSEAYKSYKDALELDPHHAAAYHKLGEIFLTQKNPELYVDYFLKAVAADSNYAPSLYQLYTYYFYRDVPKAFAYYKTYVARADASLQSEYDLTDLLYLSKDYEMAIDKAKRLMASQGAELKPRIYKLLAYSYAEKKDSALALNYMHQYFGHEKDSNLIAKDFETMAGLFAALPGKQDSALVFYEKAAGLEKDSAALYKYYKNLAVLAKSQKDYAQQAKWLSKYYSGNEEASNVDLFNWGLAYFLAQDYHMADSVFGLYVKKYPEQSFGYYWQARSNAALDKEMAHGTAIPYYEKLVEVMQKDSTNANYKKWMVEAYGYLAAFKANNEKNYPVAIQYFQKVLAVDPANADAKRYIDILQKNGSSVGSK